MKPIIAIMAAASFCGTAGAQGVESVPPKSDIIVTADGSKLRILFFGHGSIGFEYGGKHIYVDPVSEYADYSALPKADVILLTHDHDDHLDPKAIETLTDKPATRVIGNPTAIEKLGYGEIADHDTTLNLAPESNRKGHISVSVVPAYNTSPDQLKFHPKERKHNGYIFTFGGTRVYVAGDSEDTLEMLALKGIDIVFLPVNQPYTMTEEQAAHVVNALGPTIFYPYHFGGTDRKTDLEKLARLIEGSGTEMRIRSLE